MRTIFPNEIFKDIRKKDGYIALVFALGYIVFTCIYINVFNKYFTNVDIELRRLLTGICFYMFSLIVIFIILKIRKQNLTTIGFRRSGLALSIGLGIALSTIVVIIHLLNGRSVDIILYNYIFYVFIIGFGEEIVFRGFLWPRLVVTFGKANGTILTGVLFGVIHAPVKIIMNGSPLAQAVFNEIGGGIIGSLFFIFIYTRNNNIVLPSILHGLLDFFA
ncbi:MAG: CPBP family intramembrane metalloprotease [Clostridiales bacterium]|nr:CPBP family intramembrane metalloprotease [Clostridiales bacterium]